MALSCHLETPVQIHYLWARVKFRSTESSTYFDILIDCTIVSPYKHTSIFSERKTMFVSKCQTCDASKWRGAACRMSRNLCFAIRLDNGRCNRGGIDVCNKEIYPQRRTIYIPFHLAPANISISQHPVACLSADRFEHRALALWPFFRSLYLPLPREALAGVFTTICFPNRD